MRHFATLTAIICAAALAGSAFANEPSQRNQQQRQRTSQQSQQTHAQFQQGQRVNLKGTIEGYRPLQLSGEQHKHVVAKVRLDNGRMAVLDLGAIENLSNQQTQLRKGQRVEASGMPGRINRLPVIVVDRFVGDGKVTIIAPVAAVASQQARQRQQQQSQQRFTSSRDIQPRHHAQRMRSADPDRRPDPLRRGSRQQAQRQQQSSQRGMVTVTGRLTDLRDVNLSGISDSHRLVKLQTRSGQTVIADLGRKRQLQDISLDQGEVVMVQGRLGRINGKPVVFADVIGDLARIDRGSQQQQSQRQSQFRPASFQQ